MRHLKTDRCPHCGSTCIVEERLHVESVGSYPSRARGIRTHTNGQRWEERKFSCGYAVQWVPNFSSEQAVGECEISPEFVARQLKLAELQKEREWIDAKINAVRAGGKIE